MFSSWIDWRGIAAGTLLVVLFFSAPYLVRIYRQVFPDEAGVLFQKISACVSEENMTKCASPFIKELLTLKEAPRIMYALEQSLTPRQCHYIGHTVGAQLYIQYGNLAQASRRCSRRCDSACYHGVYGEMFLEDLGYKPGQDAPFDLLHLDPEDIIRVGKNTCKATSQSCHGVGHAVYQSYNAVEPSIALCHKIAAPSLFQYCANGAFMEYADVLSSVNIRAVSQSAYLKINQLNEYCDRKNEDEMHACFRYFPRMMVRTLEAKELTRADAYAASVALCARYKEDRLRNGCMGGVGSYNSFSIMADQNVSINACLALPTLRDTAACFAGQMSVAPSDRLARLRGYCGKVPSEQLKYTCFQSLFYFYMQAGGFLDTASKLCAKDDALCLRGFKDRDLNSWEILSSSYSLSEKYTPEK